MAKILVIDDDPDIVDCRAHGSGERRTSGGLCLQWQGRDSKKSSPRFPELIVLDVMMETHTEGFELAIKLHSPDPASKLKASRTSPS